MGPGRYLDGRRPGKVGHCQPLPVFYCVCDCVGTVRGGKKLTGEQIQAETFPLGSLFSRPKTFGKQYRKKLELSQSVSQSFISHFLPSFRQSVKRETRTRKIGLHVCKEPVAVSPSGLRPHWPEHARSGRNLEAKWGRLWSGTCMGDGQGSLGTALQGMVHVLADPPRNVQVMCTMVGNGEG